VGRWSYGPSTWVDIRATPTDTIVFLSRGSGVSIVRFRSQDSLRLDLLADINSRSLTGRCQVADTLLYVNSGGVECYDIHDLASPILLNWLSLPLIYDFFVVDTFLYTSSRDSFRIFSVANPARPRPLGACADSGYVMFVSGSNAYLGHQAGLFILNVSNPASPHRVNRLGYDVLSISVRDTLLYFGTTEFALRVYNVADPAIPFPVGSLSGIEAHDIYLPPTCDTVLYTPKLHVINITDPANPRQIGFVDCPGWDYGVRALLALNYALVADYFKGVVAVNVTSPAAPVVDTMAFAGDEALDITIDNRKAYLASYHAGLQILDVTDPTKPSYLGCYDTAGASRTVKSATARDSFAFASWNVPRMLSIDVTNPRHPLRAAGCDGMFNQPEDMVIRDSLVYCAEANRFQIVNVARPREPVLVGSCNLPGYSGKMDMQDSLAYVTNTVFSIVNAADPAGPTVVGNYGARIQGVDVVDTILFGTAPYTGLLALSVADPTHPYALDSLPLTDTIWWTDVVVLGSRAYVGGERVWIVDVSDPNDLRLIPGASWTPPYLIERMEYHAPYIYAACLEAGVCILESTAVGVTDASRDQPAATQFLRVEPNPMRGSARVTGITPAGRIRVFDVAGRDVTDRVSFVRYPDALCMEGDRLPGGIYFVKSEDSNTKNVAKLIKQ